MNKIQFDCTAKLMKELIQQVDLTSVKMRLKSNNGEGWSDERANQVEIQYKQFLWLTYKHQSEPIVPSRDIDKFWHYHILDTRKYADDCSHIFGYFLHHAPSGENSQETDAFNHEEAFTRTKRLFEQEFQTEFEQNRFESNAPCCGHGSCGSSISDPPDGSNAFLTSN
jgi:hypothetical protein